MEGTSKNSYWLVAMGCIVLALMVAASGRAAAASLEQQNDFTDEPTNEFDDGSSAGADEAGRLQREPSELSGYEGGQADFAAGLQADQYPVSPAASSSATFGPNHALGENNMSTDDDSDADEADIESSTSNQAAPMRAARSGHSGGRAAREQSPSGAGAAASAAADLENEQEVKEWSRDESSANEHADSDADADAQDSNIANAKVEFSAQDMAAAAGHHHHHGHGVHGWLEMGAKTGKKGAFKWHDKHPVGGKGK